MSDLCLQKCILKFLAVTMLFLAIFLKQLCLLLNNECPKPSSIFNKKKRKAGGSTALVTRTVAGQSGAASLSLRICKFGATVLLWITACENIKLVEIGSFNLQWSAFLQVMLCWVKMWTCISPLSTACLRSWIAKISPLPTAIKPRQKQCHKLRWSLRTFLLRMRCVHAAPWSSRCHIHAALQLQHSFVPAHLHSKVYAADAIEFTPPYSRPPHSRLTYAAAFTQHLCSSIKATAPIPSRSRRNIVSHVSRCRLYAAPRTRRHF